MLTAKQLAKFRARFPVLPPTDAAWRDRVVETPDEDDVRIVYADVLLERGDPMGELIGLQCRMQHLAPGAERTKLEKREAELLGKVVVREKRWRSLRGWITHEVQELGGTDCRIRAGFVEGITIGARQLQANGAALFAAAPIKALSVRHTSASFLAAFAAEPWLQRVAHLTIESTDADDHPVDGRAVEALIASPHVGNLQTLALVRGRVGPKMLVAFAQSTALAKLRSLELVGQPLRTLRAFARWPQLAELERLALRDCQLDAQAVTDLVTARMDKLVELDLSNNRIAMAGVRALAGANGLPNLATLLLERCSLRANAVETLLTARPALRDVRIEHE